MDDGTHPYESALAWTVALEPSERNFVGRAALEAIARAGSARKLVGVLLEERGVLRSHQRVVTAVGEGEMTSGGFAPTLEKSIGFARIPIEAGENLQVDIRGKLLQARVVKLPFVRHGKVLL
jgi:aminomethyltransferase